MKEHFTLEDAERIGTVLGITWDEFDKKQFQIGLNIELEHGSQNPATNITNDDAILTGKIALAHLNEFPDYYYRLTKMEQQAETQN